MVVPKIATNVKRYSFVNEICGTSVPFATALHDGFARNAAMTYANSTSVSHLKILSSDSYEPNIRNSRITTANTGTNHVCLMCVSSSAPAPIPDRSAAMLMVLPTTRRLHANQRSHGG